jgi:hypothetical protein
LFINSNHASDNLMWWLGTGFLIYLNMAPIMWDSKKQAMIKTSIFGAEIVTMEQGMEALRGLCYKLWMMGVSVSGPSYIFLRTICLWYITPNDLNWLSRSQTPSATMPCVNQ